MNKNENHMNAKMISETVAGKAVLRFWEIDSSFRCPVVGMCLTEPEQVAVLKKAGVPPKDKSPFEIHELLVGSSGSENHLSSRIDLLLNQKFGREASHIHSLDESSLLENWRECYRNGDYLAAFWGIVTRPRLSEKAKYEIFGTVHMSMHKTAEQHARNRQRLVFLENSLASRDEKIKVLGSVRRQLQKDHDELGRRVAALQAELDAERRKRKLIPLGSAAPLEQQVRTDADNQRLRQALEGQTKRTEALERLVAQLKKTVAQYALALDEQKESQAKLLLDAEDTIGMLLQKFRCSEDCPSFNLCQKRILIVGGIARMEAHYRRLIEEGGGILEYHEGHMKNGIRQLENSLKRADIVLCPVNCNSHAACSIVKNLGKKHNKPVHMMANFSLSAVSQALTSSTN